MPFEKSSRPPQIDNYNNLRQRVVDTPEVPVHYELKIPRDENIRLQQVLEVERGARREEQERLHQLCVVEVNAEREEANRQRKEKDKQKDRYIEEVNRGQREKDMLQDKHSVELMAEKEISNTLKRKLIEVSESHHTCETKIVIKTAEIDVLKAKLGEKEMKDCLIKIYKSDFDKLRQEMRPLHEDNLKKFKQKDWKI